MPDTYTLTIPAPADWLNANDNRSRYPQAAVVKAWREATVLYARQARLPMSLARVRVDAVLRFPTVRNRDEANYHPTLKPVIDGLCRDKSRVTKTGKHRYAPGYGLIWDDTPRFLDGPYIAFDPDTGPNQLTLTITDLSEDTP